MVGCSRHARLKSGSTSCSTLPSTAGWSTIENTQKMQVQILKYKYNQDSNPAAWIAPLYQLQQVKVICKLQIQMQRKIFTAFWSRSCFMHFSEVFNIWICCRTLLRSKVQNVLDLKNNNERELVQKKNSMSNVQLWSAPVHNALIAQYLFLATKQAGTYFKISIL